MDQQQRSASYEQRLRSEVSRGLEQVRQLEQKIQSIESPALYPSLISDAASIMSTFISVIQQLNHASRTNSVASPICSTRLATPPHSPSPHTTSSSSPAEGSPAAATNTPCSIPASLTLDAAASISASAENDRSAETTGVDHELLFPTDWRSNRKRKCMPKRVTKLPANTNEHGGEAPAEDGFTWRKYGQKDILNSKFPRSYYRCTHQKEMGCQATKYVQKCEDDSSMYQVTYIGEHTCQSAQQQQTSLWTCSRPLLDSPLKSSLFSSRLEDMKAARLSLSPSRSTTATGFNLLRPSSTLIPSPSQWLTPKFGGLVCPIKPEPPHLSTPPPHLATRPSPTDTDTDTDKPLLRMSLASGTQAQGEVENQSELGFWNLEELGLEQKVVMEDTSELTVSGSLEHIPKSSLTEDIPWEPMLFE